ncbi:MAG: lipoate--protein ligase family protein [Ignavibacteriae bacterium]|nr:lipoate--protein ligase family protein [Ignavibacteriota bacterium]
MERDEALARALQNQDDDGVQVLRLYGWEPPAISLGHHQDASTIDQERLRGDGIDLVRRPTGGRAILHHDELTYCVVMFSGRRSILQVYNAISEALVRGLALYGVEVSLQRSQPDFGTAYRDQSSIPCFTSSARYEIEWEGRKLVGSAQRRYADGERDVVLQHGSILCGPAHRRLAEYLRIGSEAVRERIEREMRDKTVDLAEITGRPVDRERLKECIRQGFEEAWGIQFRYPNSDI